MPRSVLLTTDTVGGVWHYALELAAALQAKDVQVILATMGGALTRSQRSQLAGIPHVVARESSFRLEWMEDPWGDVERAGEWLLAVEQDCRPDVVHLNQFAFGALPFSAPRLVVGHSCVLSWWDAVRGVPAPPEWNRYRKEVRRGLEHAQLVAAPTRAMLHALRAHYGYAGEGVVLPNARSGARYGPGPKSPFILAAGRLWDDAKNLAALDGAAPRLRWPVRVAGPVMHPGGGIRTAMHVELLGDLSPDELAAAMAQAAIYALPARYEPFGLSALEAGLSGCALVLGDIASLREVWGDAALYVPPDDHATLAATLARLIDDPALRARRGEAARERGLAYAPERMCEGYLGAYAHVLGAPRRGQVRRRPHLDPEERACAS